MPKYKLSYFNTKGRAEVARLLFTVAGVDFEDKRYTQEEWQEYKPKSPFPVMPILEVDGKSYFQSSAIVRYLAKTFGLYGSGDIEMLEVDQVLGIVDDAANVILKVFYGKEEERETLVKQANEEKVPNLMKMFEKILKANKTGYFVGKSITLADIAAYDILRAMKWVLGDPFEDCPMTKKLFEDLGSNQKIKAWNDAH